MQIKDNRIPVLDDGFIELIGTFGNEKVIAEGARVSYGMTWRGDEPITEKDIKLIKRLAKDKHTSPFEQVEMRFAVRIPMDAWRQWVRHRTANINEYSTRYKPAINSAMKAGMWRMQSKNNKQGSSGYLPDNWDELDNKPKIIPAQPGYVDVIFAGQESTLTANVPVDVVETPSVFFSYREAQTQSLARQVYEERLFVDIAREQARKDLPLSTYTELWWKNDLNNILKFLVLRTAPDAQWEIRQYAEALSMFVQQEYPNVYDYYVEHMKVHTL